MDVRGTPAPAARPLVLWAAPVAEVGGVARHLLDVARAGIPGHRLVFAVPEGPLAGQLRAAGAAVVTGPIGAADGARTAVPALRRIVSALRPQIVHTHLAFADLAVSAATAGIDVRRVSTEHGIAADSRLYQRSAAAARVKARLHSARLRRTDHVIAVSESTRKQIQRQWGSGAPITVIRNGIDRPGSPVAPAAGLRILSLSRLAPEKRLDCVLRGFAELHRTHPEARLTLAGDGPERGACADLIASLGLDDAVTMPGVVDSDSALAVHDVVVQLSAWENLSYTLLDAAARGLGIVATDVGGNAEITGGTGLIQDPSDAPAVAHVLQQQGLQPSERPALAETIPSVQGMVEQMSAVYRRMLTDRPIREVSRR